MTGRPRIPSRGITYLRAAVRANMADQIKVVRPAVPVYSPSTGYAVGTTSQTGYIGQGHVHQTDPSGSIQLGDGVEALAVVSVTIPYDAAPIPHNEDHVVVLSVGLGNDPSLVGETLRIINVSGGGIGFVTRTLTCTFVQANPFDPGA